MFHECNGYKVIRKYVDPLICRSVELGDAFDGDGRCVLTRHGSVEPASDLVTRMFHGLQIFFENSICSNYKN